MNRVPTEMELRVAKAIYDNARATYAPRAPVWEQADEKSRAAMISDTRAGIRALLPPIDAMLDACWSVIPESDGEGGAWNNHEGAKILFESMIDIASPPEAT